VLSLVSQGRAHKQQSAGAMGSIDDQLKALTTEGKVSDDYKLGRELGTYVITPRITSLIAHQSFSRPSAGAPFRSAYTARVCLACTQRCVFRRQAGDEQKDG